MSRAWSGAWGILGGTFDPIHDAHLAVAEQTCESLQLAGVLFVPAGVPPHKGDRVVTAAAHRITMVELAIADNPAFRVSRVEVDRPGRSYAVDTIERLLRDPPRPFDAGAGLVFLLSAEAFVALPEWREPDRIVELCRLAVVPRRGHPVPGPAWVEQHFPGRADRVVFLDGPDLGHSASDIRRRVAAGRSIRYLVPPAVDAYVRRHGLYVTPP